MMSLPNILTLACITAVGGVVVLGRTVIRDQFPRQNVNAFMYGDPQPTEGVATAVSTDNMTILGAAADESVAMNYAARRYHEIYAEALAIPATDETDATATAPIDNPNRAIRSSDFYRARHRTAGAPQVSTKQRTVFERSRRASYLAAQGRGFTMTGTTGYNRGTRDERPISPTGRSSVFQRSRFYKSNTTSRYTYSGNGRVRRIPRRIR